jgi:hypothetical protein
MADSRYAPILRAHKKPLTREGDRVSGLWIGETPRHQAFRRELCDLLG